METQSSGVVQHEKGSVRVDGDHVVVVARLMGTDQTRKHAIAKLKPLKLWRDGEDRIGIFLESGFGHQDKLKNCGPIENVTEFLLSVLELRPDLVFVTDKGEDMPWLAAMLGIEFGASSREKALTKLAAGEKLVSRREC